MDKAEKIILAKRQMAELIGADSSVFDLNENIFIETTKMVFWIATFGSNAVILGNKEIIAWCTERYRSTSPEDLMDADNLYQIDSLVRSYGKRLHSQNIRYLHLIPERTVAQPSGFIYRVYRADEVREFIQHEAFENSLKLKRNVIAIAAYDDKKLVSLAGADSDSGSLWQIWIDTVPEYRNHGLGAYLVKEIALEVEKEGKIPYYMTWSSNLASTRLALSVGFIPVWMGCQAWDL